MKHPTKRHHRRKHAPPKPDIRDVHGIAALLTVSVDSVYDLSKSGQLPGRKVARKWLTTRSAVMRWIEESLAADTARRAIDSGDNRARQSPQIRSGPRERAYHNGAVG